MRKDCRLNPLACHFKLNLSDDGYDKLAEKLLEEYPVGTEVTYSKVQERINLQC